MKLKTLAEQAILLYTLIFIIILSVLLCFAVIPLWTYFLIIAFIVPAEITAQEFTTKLIKTLHALNHRIEELEKK